MLLIGLYIIQSAYSYTTISEFNNKFLWFNFEKLSAKRFVLNLPEVLLTQ